MSSFSKYGTRIILDILNAICHMLYPMGHLVPWRNGVILTRAAYPDVKGAFASGLDSSRSHDPDMHAYQRNVVYNLLYRQA